MLNVVSGNDYDGNKIDDANKYKVDMAIIDYIGQNRFENWIEQNKDKTELTLYTLLEDFNITEQEFNQILLSGQVSESLAKAYDAEYILSDYTRSLTPEAQK